MRPECMPHATLPAPKIASFGAGSITSFRQGTEKGVDTAIVTDLLSLAWERAYDIAVLVSSDADFVPAVERLQEKGFKVVNATWQGHGHQLARVCWASFEIDHLIPQLTRVM